jgi:hypothetical protein
MSKIVLDDGQMLTLEADEERRLTRASQRASEAILQRAGLSTR